ncbi:MAG: tRNA (N6-threonylcarbamoyladenosine(37)-N6)-methyltransferase TrmO [Solirubrobacterales bacterium]
MTYDVRSIGTVRSSLADPNSAPKQGDEGAPDAWIDFEPGVIDALQGIEVGDQLVLLTWFDRANRDVLTTHPRGDISRPEAGVFSTRSPHRPNPIGLHRVEVLELEGPRMKVSNLEALDGTPIVDVKPVLGADVSER